MILCKIIPLQVTPRRDRVDHAMSLMPLGSQSTPPGTSLVPVWSHQTASDFPWIMYMQCASVTSLGLCICAIDNAYMLTSCFMYHKHKHLEYLALALTAWRLVGLITLIFPLYLHIF